MIMANKCSANPQIFENSYLSREKANKNMLKLIDNFLNYFSDKGYIKNPSFKISSGIDNSVHLIGSHISVFKPYLEKENIPFPGLVMSQDCIRTQNLNNYAEKDYIFNWGSSFSSLGLIAPPNRLKEVCIEAMDYIDNMLQIKRENLKIMINSQDKDFMEICLELGLKDIMEIDSMPLKYYRHKLGYENIFGRNFNFAIKDQTTLKFADVGNMIVIEKNNIPVAVELALGTSTIIKQVCGLKHVLDCSYIDVPGKMDPMLKRKIEDIIIVSVILYSEGLRPSNRGCGRILNNYVKSLSYLRKEANISLEELNNIISEFEKNNYGGKEANIYGEIIEYLKKFESKTRAYGQFVKRLKK